MIDRKFYFKKCSNCKTDIKVTPELYRLKEKIFCDSCLEAQFKKFKKSKYF